MALPELPGGFWKAVKVCLLVALLNNSYTLSLMILMNTVLATLKISCDAAFIVSRVLNLAIPTPPSTQEAAEGGLWCRSSRSRRDLAWLIAYGLQAPFWLSGSPTSLLFLEQMMAASLIHTLLLRLIGSRSRQMPSLTLGRFMGKPSYINGARCHIMLAAAYLTVFGFASDEERGTVLRLFLLNEGAQLIMFLIMHRLALSASARPWKVVAPGCKTVSLKTVSDCYSSDEQQRADVDECSICLGPLASSPAVYAEIKADKCHVMRNRFRLAGAKAWPGISLSATRAPTPLESRAVLSCGHEFHVSCLAASAKQRATCPMCRHPLDPSAMTGPALHEQRIFLMRGALIGSLILISGSISWRLGLVS